MNRHRRFALTLLLLTTAFAAPAAAQPTRGGTRDAAGLLQTPGEQIARLWQVLTEPLAPLFNIWGADDGRGVADPDGLLAAPAPSQPAADV